MTAIGLFEPTHETHLYSFCRILGTADHELTIFTTRDIADRVREDLRSDPHRWILRSHRRLGGFLSRVEANTQELDVLLVNSFYGGVVNLLQAQRFDPACPTLLFLYNIRSWLQSAPALSRSVVESLNLLCRRRLTSRLAPLAVEYPPIADYVREQTDYDGPLHTLAPTVYEPDAAVAADSEDDEAVHVTVPGYVEKSRRDYRTVLDVFERLADRKVALSLLGTPKGEYGEAILDEARDLAADGLSVTLYTDWIPIGEFDRTLAETDVLLCPLRERISTGIAEETYGTTKGSGCVWDAVRSTTPLVVPDRFAVAEYVESSTLSYADGDGLYAIIGDLLENPDELAGLQKEAHRNSQRFTAAAQRERYEAAIGTLIDGGT